MARCAFTPYPKMSARVAQKPARDSRESRKTRASRAKVARVAARGGSGGPKGGCNNATMGPCAGHLDSSGRAEGQAAMRDRKISIQAIKAAPRSFRLRGRFPPSRALIADVLALRDFCSPPSEVLGTSRASPRGQNSRRKLKFHQNRDTKGGKMRFASLCSDGSLQLEMQLWGLVVALCH